MEDKDLKVLRHSAAHLAAHAVLELFPETILTIGPATETGFFYDMQPKVNFKEADLQIITQRMQEIVKRNLPLTHEQMPKDQARTLFKNNPFKIELIDNLEGETVGIARQGDFYDLCRGGHVTHTGMLKHFILTGISGSYWRADRNGTPLQRISGTAFYTEQDLKEYLQRVEDAEKYDHRKLGKEMDLFSFQDEGVGFPFFHPKGKTVLTIMQNAMRKEWKDHNYQEIQTPTMLDSCLWQQSGHYAHYKKNMYFCEVEDKEYAVKPMNCPGSILVYKHRPRSYKELPLKLAEFGYVHRFELSGVLHGLFRVRAFTIDDAHLYCMPDQMQDQITNILQMIRRTLARFGFTELHFAVSTRPENSMGSDQLWESATLALQNGLTKNGETFIIQEGEGAFYGPKIEVTIKDSMQRSWQCSTIQVDFNQPQNFDLSYVGPDGSRHQPVMIHQAIYGSFERFLGIVLEHTKGHLPFWICPVQARIIPITDGQSEYAQKVKQQLEDAGLRVDLDTNQEPLNAKIKSAQLDKIPWMLVVGQKEADAGTITLRHASGKQEFGLTIQDLITKS
jgi:threonyl-tRNA synthetase